MIRLLVVDDEEAILFAMKDYFEALGYAVDCARDEGVDAFLHKQDRLKDVADVVRWLTAAPA